MGYNKSKEDLETLIEYLLKNHILEAKILARILKIDLTEFINHYMIKKITQKDDK